MNEKVKGINPEILKECRQQMALSVEDVQKKVRKIKAVEAGEWSLTFKQLDTLADLYNVPRWVFIADELPNDFRFETVVPAFRKFKETNPALFSHHKVRALTTRIEAKRALLLDLFEDLDQACPAFDPPEISSGMSARAAANLIRDWLGVETESFDILGWKQRLEEKGVFVFLTSKYKGWSHIDRSLLRGLSIYHSQLPIIIINDSDGKKAQSFTLFHEVGHLVRQQTALDDWHHITSATEKWCDDLAGNVLMPEDQVRGIQADFDGLDEIKTAANKFKVSPYAMIVRLRRLNLISQTVYDQHESNLLAEFEKSQKSRKENPSPIARNRPREIFNQFGNIYARTLFQAYYMNEIGLNKLAHLFGLKNVGYVNEIESML